MKFKLYCIFALLIPISMQIKCPGLTSNSPTCTSECNKAICYVDLDGFNDGKGRCCENVNEFCTATKMTTFHSKTNNGYKLEWSDHLLTHGYYKDEKTGAACPIPYSVSTYQFRRDLPVGFATNLTTALKRCEKNSDCPTGQYCGSAVNPSYNERDMRDTEYASFCYTDPIEEEGIVAHLNPSTKYLQTCDVNTACDPNVFCYMHQSGARFQTPGTGKLQLYNGICAIANVCPNPGGFTTSTGVFVNVRTSCSSDSDCSQNSKYTAELYSGTCTPVKKNSTTKVCCYQPKKCSIGMMNVPRKNCKTTKDCSADGTSWCDSQGFCCRNEEGTALTCPDGATLAVNEPPCSQTKLDVDKSSGFCDSNPTARCYLGFCCPTLVKAAGEYLLGAFTYVTKMTCKVGEIVPQTFSYCLNGNITVLGKDAIKKPFESYEVCKSQTDCANGTVCVRGNDATRCVPTVSAAVTKRSVRIPLLEICIFVTSFVAGISVRYVIKAAIAKKLLPNCCSHKNKPLENDLEANMKGASKDRIGSSPITPSKAVVTTPVRNKNAPSTVKAVAEKKTKEANKEISKASTSKDTPKPSTSKGSTSDETPKPSTPTSKEGGTSEEPKNTQTITVASQPRLVREETTKTMKKLVNQEFLFPKLDHRYFSELYFHGHIPFALIELREKSEWALYTKLYYDDNNRKCVKLMLAVCRSDQTVLQYEIEVNENGVCQLVVPGGCKLGADSLGRLLVHLKEHGIPSTKKTLGKAVSRPIWVIDHSKVDVFFKKQLGAGAFGAVYKGRMKETDVAVAVKTVCQDDGAKDKVADEELKIKMLVDEIMIASRLDHRNIVQTFGMVVSSSPVFAVMEFCPGGDLESFLKKGLKISDGELGCLALEAMSGVVYLHAHNVLHNDLATRNCLIAEGGRIKLADFGLSIKLKRGQSHVQHDIKRMHVPIRLMAPETLQKGGQAIFSRKSDIWGAGSLLFEIFNRGLGIWHDDFNHQRIATNIRKIQMPYDTFKGPEAIVTLLKSIWILEPRDRPSAKDICQSLKDFLKVVDVPDPRDFVINTIGVKRDHKDQDVTEDTSVMKDTAKTQYEEPSKQPSKKE